VGGWQKERECHISITLIMMFFHLLLMILVLSTKHEESKENFFNYHQICCVLLMGLMAGNYLKSFPEPRRMMNEMRCDAWKGVEISA
jgi:hypothetical protein